MNTTKALYQRLEALRGERDSRMARGVPVPSWIPAAIAVIEGQLANSYHEAEAANEDEARFMKLQPVRTDESGWWKWFLGAALVCAALAGWLESLK